MRATLHHTILTATFAAVMLVATAAPAGAVIDFRCGDNLCQVNGDGSQPQQLTNNGTSGDPYTGPSLSSDGAELSVAFNGYGYLEGSANPIKLDPGGTVVFDTKLSASGQTVAQEGSNADPGGVYVCEAPASTAGESTVVCNGGSNYPLFSFGWAADGGLLYSESNAGTAYICHAVPPANACTAVASYSGYDLTDPAVSPNGQELAVVATPTTGGTAFEGSIWLFNYSTGALISKLTDGTADTTPSWSPDGTKIAFTRDGALYVTSATGSPGDEKEIDSGAGLPSPGIESPTWGGPDVSPPPPPSKLKLSLTVSKSQRVVKQKDVVVRVQCNVACTAGASAGIRIGHSKKLLDAKSVASKLAGGGSATLKLGFSKSVLKAISKALAHHEKVTADVIAEAETSSQKVTSTASFTVKH
jgi:WD40-like Beta Propeller Repeat